jgi:hypothetical protein
MKKISYMMIAVAGLVLTACSDEVESTFGNDALAVKFTANVGTASRSANDYIANGATVKISNGGRYFGYEAGDDGNLTPTDGDFIRWSSASQGSMAIMAYTPATDAASINSFTIAADQSSTAGMAAADYATFDGTVSRLANSNNVSFELTRQLAQVNVNIASVDKRYTDTDDDKFTFDVTVFSPSTTVTDGVGDGKALEVTPYSSSETASTAIIAAGQADDTAKFLAVQVKRNGIAVGNPLIARGRPVLEAGNSYTLNLTVLYDEVSISSVQLTDWVTVDTIEGGEAEKVVMDEIIINTQSYDSPEDIRNAISEYCDNTEGDKYVTLSGTLNGWSIYDVLGLQNHMALPDEGENYNFRINYLNLDGVTDLEEFPDHCFSSCETLKSISAANLTTLGYACISYCPNLTEVNFPSVELTESDIFNECKSLTTVSLPKAKTLGSFVFWNCSALTSVYLPQATTFGAQIFRDCNTTAIDLTLNESQSANVSGNTWTDIDAYYGETTTYTFKSITLVNVVNLQDYDSADDVHNAIRSSSNVILVGQLNDWGIANIFYHDPMCSILSINLDGITDLTEFQENTFLDFNTLEKLSASQVINLGECCCAYLDNLQEVNFPSVEYVGLGALRHCSSLTSISLPKAETISGHAFRSCTSLISVNLPNVKTIGSNVFTECKSLTYVYIPNATKFDSDIFLDCNTENIDLTLNESQRANVEGNTWTYTAADVQEYSYTFKSITFAE